MLIGEILFEDLGTLQQLNVGPLINVLKQDNGYRGKAGTVKSRFINNQISNTSVVTEPILLKQGFKTLRKAFLDLGKGTEIPQAFALYLNNEAVAFGTFDYDDLRGGSRTGKFAYDLTPVADVINQMDDEAHAAIPKYDYSRDQPRQPSNISSYSEEEPYYTPFDRDKTTVSKPRKYQGKIISTNELSTFINRLETIIEKTGAKLTARIVMSDKKAQAKSRSRYSNKEVKDAAEDLKKRLSIYKNSKKPTVNTIEQFIEYSLKHPGKNVQFAGHTYKLTATSYDKINPVELLKGRSFTTRYSCIDPGSYESLNLTYKFDRETNQLIPVKAEWKDGRDKANFRSQEAVLDPKGYAKVELGNIPFNKEEIVKTLLEKMKNQYYNKVMNISYALMNAGYDWPELQSIYNSAKNEVQAKRGF